MSTAALTMREKSLRGRVSCFFKVMLVASTTDSLQTQVYEHTPTLLTLCKWDLTDIYIYKYILYMIKKISWNNKLLSNNQQ